MGTYTSAKYGLTAPDATDPITNGDDQIRGLADTTDAALAALDGIYRTLIPWHGGDVGGGAGSTRFFVSDPAATTITTPSFLVAHLNPADLNANGRTVKYRVKAVVGTNAVAPGITITFGLYPLTFTPGASGVASTWVAGAVVAGSTIAFATPAANGQLTGNSGDFTAPATGYFAVGFALSSNTAANSVTHLRAMLQARQV